ncbi:hypothetical protein P8452_70053 [Trifolium repens]|nr:hypothetical protein P8452_70053 [Trifolium repens]
MCRAKKGTIALQSIDGSIKELSWCNQVESFMEFNSKKQGGFRVGWLNPYLETALHINGFVNFHREMNSGRIFEDCTLLVS